MHLDSKLPNVGLRSRIQQFVGANTPEELELMYHGEIKEDGFHLLFFSKNVEAHYNKLKTPEKKKKFMNGVLSFIDTYKSAPTTRYPEAARILHNDMSKHIQNPDECMKHIKKYTDNVLKNKPIDLHKAQCDMKENKRRKRIEEEEQKNKLIFKKNNEFYKKYKLIIANKKDLRTKKQQVRELYNNLEYDLNDIRRNHFDTWWNDTPYVKSIKNREKKTMKYIKLGAGAAVTMAGLAALYYNRKFLTKHILKYTFKKDLQKYKKYKRNHTAKKQKPMTFKRWYHKEYPPPKGTQKHNTIINSALEKIDRLKMV